MIPRNITFIAFNRFSEQTDHWFKVSPSGHLVWQVLSFRTFPVVHAVQFYTLGPKQNVQSV